MHCCPRRFGIDPLRRTRILHREAERRAPVPSGTIPFDATWTPVFTTISIIAIDTRVIYMRLQTCSKSTEKNHPGSCAALICSETATPATVGSADCLTLAVNVRVSSDTLINALASSSCTAEILRNVVMTLHSALCLLQEPTWQSLPQNSAASQFEHFCSQPVHEMSVKTLVDSLSGGSDLERARILKLLAALLASRADRPHFTTELFL